MTGGGRGFCNPSRASYGPAPAQWTGYGRGFGRGYDRGFGRGYDRGFGRGYGRGRGLGRGAGFGRGRGFGWRGFSHTAGGWVGPAYGPGYGSPYDAQPEEEVKTLKDEAKYMKNELDAINKRIEELETEASET
jgi:hypothetical protein